ncbi:MAG TPA: patatin-like phospholipase family protein, partial [Albitalea sp.]
MSVPFPRRTRWLGAVALLALAACQTAPVAPPVAPPVVPPVAPPDVPAVVDVPLPSVPVLPRIGLALGGGAARGFAHIGVIQVLEEHGIRPDLVVGTSAGSLVATLYASGKNAT